MNLKQLNRNMLSAISFEKVRKQRKLKKILEREFKVLVIIFLRVIANMLFVLITHSMRTLPAIIIKNMKAVDQRSANFLLAHGVQSEADGYQDKPLMKAN